MIARILRNIVSLLTGHVISKFFSLACIIFLAKRLRVDNFGTYGTITAYLTLFSAFADNGLSTITIRDLSQDYRRAEELFVHSALLRILLSILAYAVLLFSGYFWWGDDYSLLFIMICGLFLFPEAIRKLGVSMLSGIERMDIVAALNVVSTVFRYVPFILAIILGKSLETAFFLLVISWSVVAGLWLLGIKRYCLQHGCSPVHFSMLWRLLSHASPFGVMFILSIIYFKADILMLAKMQGSAAVGFYEGAYKFVEASMFIPTSLVNVLLPVMSKTFVTDKDSYATIYFHATRVLATSILPVVISISFFSEEIITFVYNKEYNPSAPALSLLIWVLFIIFLNAPVGNVIATSSQMNAFLPFAFGNTLLNILLNFILIPRYSFLGASFTTVFTECTGFIIQLWFVKRIIGGTSGILRFLRKLLIAGSLASLVCYLTKTFFFFPLNFFLMLLTYIVSISILKIIEPCDKKICFELIRLVKTKLQPGDD
ncbi:MAG: flippase [bacterium]|nr:flippase [bacterium]